MGLKYIVLEVAHINGEVKHEWPIIFPDAMVHKQVSEYISRLLGREHSAMARPIAAGKISFLGMNVRCYDESETLRLKSRGKQDEQLIKLFDYQHGITERGTDERAPDPSPARSAKQTEGRPRDIRRTGHRGPRRG